MKLPSLKKPSPTRDIKVHKEIEGAKFEPW